MSDELTQFLEAIKNGSTPTTPANSAGPTPAALWRASRTQTLVLPSGNVIVLRQVGIYDLIEQGSIPQTLSAEAAAVAGMGMAKVTEEQLRKYVQIINLVVCACAVEPKLLPRPEQANGFNAAPPDGGLYVDELTFVDRQEIFKWACGLGHRLQSFRPESAGTLPAA